MLPSSAIEFPLPCDADSKIPPIDVIELARDVLRESYRALEPNLGEESYCGKGYWFAGGLDLGDTVLSTDRLGAGEDMSDSSLTAFGGDECT